MSKKQLGQFFTTEADYIFQGFDKYIAGKKVFDPFAGAGDLLEWASHHGAENIIGYDVDQRYTDGERVIFNDSLLNSGQYEFVLTNPPYLNVNKADKLTKEKYFLNSGYEDLYQISLDAILNSQEGIVIVPINFLSAENSKKIRNKFFSKFEILEMNYFRHQVFRDTTYNVISFYYRQKENPLKSSIDIKTTFFPSKEKAIINLDQRHHWTIGGSALADIRKQENLLKIYRLAEEHLEPGESKIRGAYTHIKQQKTFKVHSNLKKKIGSNILLLRAIDSGRPEGKIRLEDLREYGISCLVSKETSRNMIQLIIDQEVPIDHQKKLIKLFNTTLNQLRSQHASLFLTNFRDNDRKRISFNFAYKLINYLYFTKLSKTPSLFDESVDKEKLRACSG